MGENKLGNEVVEIDESDMVSLHNEGTDEEEFVSLNNAAIGSKNCVVNDPDENADDSSKAPDGGWGWVCVFACFCMHILIGGLGRAYGIIYLDLLDTFNSTAAETALVGGMMSTLRTGLGFIGTTLSNRFTSRKVVMAGGLFLIIGCLLSAFPPNLPYLYFSYSLIAGFGGALVYAPGLATVGEYFDKRRGIAIGLSTAGSGFGSFIFPPIIQILLTKIKYKGTMLFLAGLMGAHLLIGAVYKPLKNKPTRRLDKCEDGTANATELETLAVEDTDEITETSKCGNDAANTEGVNTDVHADSKEQRNGVLEEIDDSVQNSEIDCEERKRTCGCCGKRSNSAKPLLDLSLLKDIHFMPFALSVLFANVSYNPAFMLVAALGKEKGTSDTQAAFLLSGLGIADTIGRASCGFFFDSRFVKPGHKRHYFTFSMIASATIATCWPFAESFGTLMVCSVLHGFVTSIMISQRHVMVANVVKPESYYSGVGLTTGFQGVGIAIGPPLAGLIRDKTGSYTISYFYMGGMMVFAALIFQVDIIFNFCRSLFNKKERSVPTD
ncbi:unnamed protein product [Owenia fusiformis]|uniref:Uncharacterized protein n=1 Tax=Owenia fusiformis TaxID=6347 RepID=A0A8J1XVE2_OWEFU|nr:unnamed protein product [Owenia fusiformis]